jgi:prophage regulatory protein
MIYALMLEDKFPRQFKLGSRAVGWRESDIEKWIKERTSNKA